jgi:hypothetical protein
MGRRKGQLQDGSVQHWVSTFAVGEVRWKETTLERYQHDQRELICAKSRRPEWMRDWAITVGLFTAVSSSKAGEFYYLIRVERTI